MSLPQLLAIVALGVLFVSGWLTANRYQQSRDRARRALRQSEIDRVALMQTLETVKAEAKAALEGLKTAYQAELMACKVSKQALQTHNRELNLENSILRNIAQTLERKLKAKKKRPTAPKPRKKS
jgi:hypothetical protein